MGIDDSMAALEGIVACAVDNRLSLIRAIKRATGQPVLLLCCNLREDGTTAHAVPVAELIIGRDIGDDYVTNVEPDKTYLEVGEPGVDKPL